MTAEQEPDMSAEILKHTYFVGMEPAAATVWAATTTDVHGKYEERGEAISLNELAYIFETNLIAVRELIAAEEA